LGSRFPWGRQCKPLLPGLKSSQADTKGTQEQQGLLMNSTFLRSSSCTLHCHWRFPSCRADMLCRTGKHQLRRTSPDGTHCTGQSPPAQQTCPQDTAGTRWHQCCSGCTRVHIACRQCCLSLQHTCPRGSCCTLVMQGSQNMFHWDTESTMLPQQWTSARLGIAGRQMPPQSAHSIQPDIAGTTSGSRR